jgi:hypothetical protein
MVPTLLLLVAALSSDSVSCRRMQLLACVSQEYTIRLDDGSDELCVPIRKATVVVRSSDGSIRRTRTNRFGRATLALDSRLSDSRLTVESRLNGGLADIPMADIVDLAEPAQSAAACKDAVLRLRIGLLPETTSCTRPASQ